MKARLVVTPAVSLVVSMLTAGITAASATVPQASQAAVVKEVIAAVGSARLATLK